MPTCRLRTQLALDGYTTAGSRNSYEFHARTASAEVADVAVDSPDPGVVRVVILSRTGDGQAPPALTDAVAASLNAEDVRPLCDTVMVQSAVIVPFAVTASLTVASGPDHAVVLAEARAALTRHLAEVRGVGRDVARSGIFAALHRPGVESVTLTAPAADIAVGPTEAAHCTLATVTITGAP